ncbi:hypothetical protein PF002_g18840 [Phytophthora fragariae]|uniref:Uncharacterized protein n=1 Tax=Phytophthora fragariae TaxID=53985 RepID=A0A6A3Y378_9STRA|nr:hypothetical protein PF002_g18840 [Phytophthora fragariae]
MMAISKCNPVKNTAEVCARDVLTVADETCADAAPSADEKGSRSATVGVCNVESPVCDNAGPVCVTNILVNQVNDQDRRDETDANQVSGPDRRGGTRPNLGRNQCRTPDMGDESGMRQPVPNSRDTRAVTDGTRDDSALSAEWEGPRVAPSDVFPVDERDHKTTGLACATRVPGKQMSDQDRRDETRCDLGRNQCRTERNQCRTTDMGDGTETRGHASNSDQGLDTHSRAADHDSGAEYVVDEQVGVVQRGDRHPGDAEAQQTQLPEDTATDKEVKTEEAGAKDKEIKTEKAGATDEKIRTEEAGGKQDGVKDGGNLDSKGADGPEVTTMTKEGKIEDAGDEQVCIKEGGDLYAEDVEESV